MGVFRRGRGHRSSILIIHNIYGCNMLRLHDLVYAKQIGVKPHTQNAYHKFYFPSLCYRSYIMVSKYNDL